MGYYELTNTAGLVRLTKWSNSLAGYLLSVGPIVGDFLRREPISFPDCCDYAVTIALRLAVSRFVCLKYIIYPISLKQTRWYRAKSDYGNPDNSRAHVNQSSVFQATFPCNRNALFPGYRKRAIDTWRWSRYLDRQAGIFRRWPSVR